MSLLAPTTFATRRISSLLINKSTISQSFHHQHRKFAFSTTRMAAKQEWLVILPDTAGNLEKRMEVRPTHLENIKPHVQSGFLVMGGATLDEPLTEGQAPKFNGSCFMAVADSREEVEAFVHQDVYTTSGVWDTSKIQIIPFKSALRKELQN